MGGREDDDDGCTSFSSIFQEEDDKEEECQQIEYSEVAEDAITISDDQRHHLSSINSDIVIRQLRSLGLSFQLWPAASTLVSLIDRTPSLVFPPSTFAPSSPLRILELGSGTGIVGIAAAAVLGANVTITDLPQVLPNLQFNADANRQLVVDRGGEVVVRQLRWGCEEDFVGLGCYDVVLASDVVYYEELIEPLVKTLRFFVRGEVVFVMAHLRRWKKRDSIFFRKARKVFDVKVLHQDPPLDGNRVGVVVYRFVENGRGRGMHE